jgi:hypothetical protein
VLHEPEKRKEAAMNAMTWKPAWPLAPARQLRLKRRAWGFALYEPQRRPGMPLATANVHARFEHEARQALREWLMV